MLARIVSSFLLQSNLNATSRATHNKTHIIFSAFLNYDLRHAAQIYQINTLPHGILHNKRIIITKEELKCRISRHKLWFSSGWLRKGAHEYNIILDRRWHFNGKNNIFANTTAILQVTEKKRWNASNVIPMRQKISKRPFIKTWMVGSFLNSEKLKLAYRNLMPGADVSAMIASLNRVSLSLGETSFFLIKQFFCRVFGGSCQLLLKFMRNARLWAPISFYDRFISKY